MAKRRRKRGLGLLPGTGFRTEAREGGGDPLPAGEEGPPAGTRAERAENRPAAGEAVAVRGGGGRQRAPEKAWQERCYFSCIPWQWKPVDVYNPDGTEITAEGEPA